MSTSTSTSTDPPPPDYVPSQPQILITPLPDSASFFWGRTVQGEIYVKGLGEGSGNRTNLVKSLSVQLSLTNHLPNHPTLQVHEFPIQTLYPPNPTTNISSSTLPTSSPFSTSHRFSIHLPSSSSQQAQVQGNDPLPGTLNLTSYEKGEIRYSLSVKLILPNDQVISEEMRIEGTPQEVSCQDDHTNITNQDDAIAEVEEKLEKDGALARLLIDQDQPRLGELLRLGLEIRPAERKKTGVIGLAKQSDPIETLRPLRRVRVELFRKVVIRSNESSSSIASSSSTTHNSGSSYKSMTEHQHLTLLHASGKSLRYPGTGRNYPPLRVLFTIPTAQLGVVAEQTWGEITSTVPYHSVNFFIRVTIGFGDISPNNTNKDWILSREITIRPKRWKEPRDVVVDRGMIPNLGNGTDSPIPLGVGLPTENDGGPGSTSQIRQGSGSGSGIWTEEDYRKEAYRQKGRDVVGDSGTFRPDNDGHNDLPPPFESDQAGPSTSTSNTKAHGPGEGGLPSFLESEEQARAGDVPVLNQTVRSERLVPVNFDQDDQVVIPDENDTVIQDDEGQTEGFDRNNWVGRRGSLGGELGTWVEYDGYETFSVAPPSMDASYGAGGAMDPPQEGDENSVNVVGGMVARLGLEGEGVSMQGLELMEHLGLGEGTRIVDLQDDLPPGIDEPSLPALPDFHPHSHVNNRQSPPPAPYISPSTHTHTLPPAHDPPSFDASQAANAVGGVATSHIRSPVGSNIPLGVGVGGRRPSRHAFDDTVGVGHVSSPGDAPPGYERAGGEGGLPPYS
ncbi:hypothetical protein I302_104496 [Kwoniella bestiolae CBS 10118]|uniref:Uncharacterized protein n=1 Tax=Kwoniella bestiolae CBS 10118 TaxID=1296100 RepID=A0A1B9GBF0_9TREE|nr:hypothetical protein I302_03202 [Kwoniella bestiolae CBS 10118]OCF28343.1 hypothetical protein I302_03202 [Kwoniella bestiolae CBS 10118]